MKRIMLFAILLLIPSIVFAGVTVNGTRHVNDNIQVNALTITYDGDSYRYMANTPVLTGAELQAYVDAKENQYVYGILHSLYPNAKFQDFEGNNALEKMQAWITAGHTNAAYCPAGQPYCTTEAIPAYCDGAEGDDQATCEANEGTWIPEVPQPTTQETCVEPGVWVTVFDTEEKCGLAGSQWIPEQVIAKVPWVDSWSISKVTAENDFKDNPLSTMTKAQLNTYIDQNWTNLTDSKVAFKKLVELIYDMNKRQGW